MSSGNLNKSLKIAVVGDTHGRIKTISRELQKIDIDHLLFTGDFYSDAKRIAHQVNVDFSGVAGNCDPYDSNLKEELLLQVVNKKIYIVHGHQYNVKRSLGNLFYRAQELKADIVAYGHTHRSDKQYIEDILFINPGSPSRPRGAGKSFILLEVGENKLNSEIIFID